MSILLVVVSGCSFNNINLLSNGSEYSKLSNSDKSKIKFIFIAKHHVKFPGWVYTISIKIKNKSSKKVVFDQNKFKVIDPNTTYKSAKNSMVTIKPHKSILLSNIFHNVSGESVLGSCYFEYGDFNNVIAYGNFYVKNNGNGMISSNNFKKGSAKKEIQEIHHENKKAIALAKKQKKASSIKKSLENKYGKAYKIGEMFVHQYKKEGYLRVPNITLTVMKNGDTGSYIFELSNGVKVYVLKETKGTTYMYHPMQVGQPNTFLDFNPLNVKEFEYECDPVESNFSVTYQNGKLINSSY